MLIFQISKYGLGTTVYTIHCACITVSDTLSEIISGYYSGLFINYSNDIESENKGLLKKVDLIGGYGTLFSIIFLIVMMYPSWLFLAKTVSWNDCNPYGFIVLNLSWRWSLVIIGRIYQQIKIQKQLEMWH